MQVEGNGAPLVGQGGAPLVGQVLEGRYRIDSYLARGGMSTVYEGVDLRLDRPVAIKVMTPQYAADATFLKRFEREARAAAKLDNPHVVGVYDQGRDGESVFLIMELVDGGTLRDLIHQQGQLSVRVTLSVLEPILDALSAAHTAGLIHRDIKPENVLISSRGEVKVADFGLVRAVTSTTMATGDVILGTVAYLSPEQVETGAADERSDVYSAGIVAYEMLTGRPPFVGDNAISVAYQHVHGEVPPVADHAPGVPSAIAAVIDDATARDCLERPANAGDFLRRLRGARLQAGLSLATVPVPRGTRRPPATSAAHATAVQPTPNRPDHTPPPPRAKSTVQLRRQRRRRRRLTALIAILVLIAAAAAGGIWLANRWTSAPSTVKQPTSAAVSIVQSAGLRPALATRYDDAMPSGLVVAQDPPADTRLRNGAAMTLVVSGGRPAVPTIKPGMARAAAEAAIRSASLTPVINASSNVYDDVLATGTVVSTKPASGQHAKIGSDVLLVISRGPTPELVPEVAGKQTEDAQNKLLVTGFTLGPLLTRFDADVVASTVIGTDPPAGSANPRGTSVSLILAVSKTVPQVPSQSIDTAAATLRDGGFTVTIGNPVFDETVPGGDVVSIEPIPGTRIDPADPQVTLIGSNAVTVPSVTGKNVRQAKQLLSDSDLSATVRSLFGSDSAVVTDQQPESGMLAEPGSTVRLSAWP
ncbi:MAG: Stk1 family PASTA domain-containing Ser/Thr kinase [Nakamurella sp.]